MSKNHWSNVLTIVNNTPYTINWIEDRSSEVRTKHHIHTVDPNGGTITNTIDKDWKKTLKDWLDFFQGTDPVWMTAEITADGNNGYTVNRGDLPADDQNIKMYFDVTATSQTSGTSENKTGWQTGNWTYEEGMVFTPIIDPICNNKCDYVATITFSTQDTEMITSEPPPGIPPISEYEDRF